MCIDSSWSWSSNTGFLMKLRIGCAPVFEISFNQDSTKLYLKTPKDEIDISKYKVIFEDCEKGAEYDKVMYPSIDFNWNCGSFQNWRCRSMRVNFGTVKNKKHL